VTIGKQGFQRSAPRSRPTDKRWTGTFPYGESWYTASGEKLVFTTYERDAESGNDYAMARTYSSTLGRFTAVDPLNGDISNPQSLNRYVYALDDPINGADPAGDSTISAASWESAHSYNGGVGTGDAPGAPGGGSDSGSGKSPGTASTGDTSTDSHRAVASINGDLAHLQKVEFPPFKRAIDAGVDSILLAHARVPALDPDPDRITTVSSYAATGVNWSFD
jgi:RHS repeat-associated protein